MKLYHTPSGIVIEEDNQFYPVTGTSWEEFVNDDQLAAKARKIIAGIKPGDENLIRELLPPIGPRQELWACGVTYLRSKIGRQEESQAAGGGDFYGKVYEAERPEVFFKSIPQRVVGHKGFVRIRKDSTWDAPEPELTLLVTTSGKIVGYTVGNDMSSRSIEGENPLYLPQAKTYDECASLGPCVLIAEKPISPDSMIYLDIKRNQETVFEGTVSISQMKRTHPELVSYAFRECSFPVGCLIMTGTGIVPGSDFTLKAGDEIHITIDGIGTLINTVRYRPD